MIRKLYILLCLAFVVLAATAQTDRQYIRKGNAAFAAKKYGEAEVNYRKALAANGQNAIAAYDLGCADTELHVGNGKRGEQSPSCKCFPQSGNGVSR